MENLLFSSTRSLEALPVAGADVQQDRMDVVRRTSNSRNQPVAPTTVPQQVLVSEENTPLLSSNRTTAEEEEERTSNQVNA